MSQVEHKIPLGEGFITFSLAISGYGEGTSDECEFKMDLDKKGSEYLMTTDQFKQLDDRTIEESSFSKINNLYKDGEPGSTMIIPTGVTAIYGMTGAGKSELAKMIGRRLNVSNDSFIRFHEPELPSILSVDVLFRELSEFLKSDRKIFIWDSARFFVYNTNGRRAAGKGGISSAFYSDLTALSVLASYLGKTIIVVINPMVDDPKDVGTIANALEGSLSAVMQAKSYGKFKMTARTSYSQREPELFEFISGDDNGSTNCDDGDYGVTITQQMLPDLPVKTTANQFAQLFK